jgi:hypothetical protein
MQPGFANVVEEVKKLTSEEKEELLFLIQKYLAEEKRKEIYEDYQTSLQELRENRLEFSSDINQLKNMAAE